MVSEQWLVVSKTGANLLTTDHWPLLLELKRRPSLAAFFHYLRIVSGEVAYAPFTFSACQPLGPLTTSNCTCWPSCKLRKPLAWMAEK